MSNIQIDANKLVAVLQRKISELTAANIVQEVQISSLHDSNAELVKQLADLSTSLKDQTAPEVFNSIPAYKFPE